MAINELQEVVDQFPSFQPHPLLRSGHLQTLAGAILRSNPHPYRAVKHQVELPDGDVMFLHDDRPSGWQPTSPVTLLLHGVMGCHQSSYMVNAAAQLNAAGVRTFRMDMRACGAGEGLSCMPYNPGCSDDLQAALQQVVRMCPAAPLSLVGYSVGGNVILKLAGEAPQRLPPQVNRMVVVSPPIDLKVCADGLTRGVARIYDRYIAFTHLRHLRRSESLVRHAPNLVRDLRSRGQREFDQGYTAKLWGYETVDAFYNDTSSRHVISNIQVPTLLIAAQDDPLVPVRLFEPLRSLAPVSVLLTDHGGHLGFVGRRGSGPERRWLDWRIVDYITARQAKLLAAAA